MEMCFEMTIIFIESDSATYIGKNMQTMGSIAAERCRIGIQLLAPAEICESR